MITQRTGETIVKVQGLMTNEAKERVRELHHICTSAWDAAETMQTLSRQFQALCDKETQWTKRFADIDTRAGTLRKEGRRCTQRDKLYVIQQQ